MVFQDFAFGLCQRCPNSLHLMQNVDASRSSVTIWATPLTCPSIRFSRLRMSVLCLPMPPKPRLNTYGGYSIGNGKGYAMP